MDEERELTRTLEGMRAVWVRASGASHSHLDALLDPNRRHDASTRNYLASGASGTLRDRLFHPANGDRVSDADAASVNDRYRRLLDDATRLSVRLNLPATADWTPTDSGELVRHRPDDRPLSNARPRPYGGASYRRKRTLPSEHPLNHEAVM